jgi:hypothetical protein
MSCLETQTVECKSTWRYVYWRQGPEHVTVNSARNHILRLFAQSYTSLQINVDCFCTRAQQIQSSVHIQPTPETQLLSISEDCFVSHLDKVSCVNGGSICTVTLAPSLTDPSSD